jgi:gamma-glutamyltranspeptidase/glutathione hydrolase
VHLLVEAERRAYADRAAYLGDPDFNSIPVDTLISDHYLETRFSDFHPRQATTSQSVNAEEFGLAKDVYETTHLSIVDGDGNAAAVTTTLNDNYGCKVWVPGAGFFLNNEMDDFSIKPGVPNIYGLIGGEANAIAPGKRMLSSMTPTIIEKNGALWMVLGTPGGSTIITTVVQVFLNKAVYGKSIQDAVHAGRYHHQWLPDEIVFEKNTFSEELQALLIARGHTLREVSGIGLVEAIWVDANSVLHGVADLKEDDHASGW